MHALCMATKTISLELDAYERLRRAKRSPRESFSGVVRRAIWRDATPTAGDVLAIAKKALTGDYPVIDEAVLDRLDEAQRLPRVSQSEW